MTHPVLDPDATVEERLGLPPVQRVVEWDEICDGATASTAGTGLAGLPAAYADLEAGIPVAGGPEGGRPIVTAEVSVGGRPIDLNAPPTACKHRAGAHQRVTVNCGTDEATGEVVRWQVRLELICVECAEPFYFADAPAFMTRDGGRAVVLEIRPDGAEAALLRAGQVEATQRLHQLTQSKEDPE